MSQLPQWGKYLLTVLATALVVGLATYFIAKPSSPSTSSTTTPLITLSAAPSVTPTPQSSATPTANTVTQCASSDLSATLTNGNGTAGTYYYTLALKNISGTTCSYSGTTKVSLADKNNNALTTATATTVSTLSLDPGVSMYAPVGFPDSGNFTGAQACKSGVTTLAIYPPNQNAAVTVTGLDTLQPNFTNFACNGFSVLTFSLTAPS